MVKTTGKQAHQFRKEEEIYKGNRIILVGPEGERMVDSLPNVDIVWEGNNSLIRIQEDFHISKMKLFVGEGAYIEIGKYFRVRFYLSIDARGKDTTVRFGKFVNIGRGEIYAGDEDGLEVMVGDEFLGSLNMTMRTSDSHTIYDINTRQPCNVPRFGIHIGNHVWCGYGVMFLKDTEIPDNCVIGAGSVVGNSAFSDNSIIAGVPAKTIKTGVNWDKRSVAAYMHDEFENTDIF